MAQIDLEPLRYELPEGFRVMDFASPEFDPDRYYNAIWRGFNNQRPRNRREIASAQEREEFSALHYDRRLRVLVVAPNGDYASHCGMWHLQGERFAYVEPVFTLPEYRGIGLGRAAVYEGLERCRQRGAQAAFVGSSQQFYYRMGFAPFRRETWWERN